MNFDFLRKYNNYETLISWKNLLSDEDWYKFSSILYSDSIRYFRERQKYYSYIIKKLNNTIDNEKNSKIKEELKLKLEEKINNSKNIRFDYGFYGKCSELRLAYIFKEERI